MNSKPSAASNVGSGDVNGSVHGNGAGQNTSADDSRVHRVAQKAHQAVDVLEQSIDAGSQKVMQLQQTYGAHCREQIRANPLASVGIAFVVGYVLAKITRG